MKELLASLDRLAAGEDRPTRLAQLTAQGWSQERRAMKLKVSRRSIQYWDGGNTPSRQADLFAS